MNARGPAGAALPGRPRTAPPARRCLVSWDQVEAPHLTGCSSAFAPKLPRVTRDARRDEVDGVPDGLDPGRLLLADADPVLILELHDELVEIEGIGVEILAEAGLGPDALG